MEIRARVISQEKGLYKISYEGEEKLAEVSGKFRYEAGTCSKTLDRMFTYPGQV